jgi:hypothetical protein
MILDAEGPSAMHVMAAATTGSMIEYVIIAGEQVNLKFALTSNRCALFVLLWPRSGLSAFCGRIKRAQIQG